MKKLISLAVMLVVCLHSFGQATLNENAPSAKIICNLSLVGYPAANTSAVKLIHASLTDIDGSPYQSYVISIITCNTFDDNAFCYLGTRDDALTFLRSLENAMTTKESGTNMSITDDLDQLFYVTIYPKSIDIGIPESYSGVVVEDDYALIHRKQLQKAIALLEEMDKEGA